jgi:two-component system, NtrC family, nitrogen regulation sensor histidine kinase NtrY
MGLLQRLGSALSPEGELGALREEVRRLRERLSQEESAAREREQILQAVVDAAPAAIVLLDEVGTIVFTNAGARDLFFEGAEPTRKNFLAMLSGVPEPLRKALLSEADHIFTFDCSGESETYHLAKRQLTLHGEPHSLLIVRHMTLELSRQENAVLRKAIRVIHHELANSLTPVTSLLQSARRRVSEAQLDAAGTAGGAAGAKLEQMLAVIEDRVSHLDAFLTGFAALGKLPKPRPQEVAWEAFLGGLHPLLPDISIAGPPAGNGWFDQAQIQQIIINLVKNAREAGSPPSEIRLEVATAAEGGHRVSVIDRGPGMTDRVMENATVPSFTTKPNGSGMGLALCREIVDAHQGHLRIARREGGGTSVSFWLPPRTPLSALASRSRARLSLSRG